jgi:hypothetical protein
MNPCRVCGLDLGIPPWGYDGQTPQFIICDCCGVEAGYEDCSVESCRQYRKEWIAKGSRWFDPKCKPTNWSLEEQVKHVLSEYL